MDQNIFTLIFKKKIYIFQVNAVLLNFLRSLKICIMVSTRMVENCIYCNNKKHLLNTKS